MTIKSYQVLSLLNCLEKVCWNVVADMLSEWCKVNHVLYKGQMGSRRQRSNIGPIARVISLEQEASEEGRLVAMILIYVKGAFNQVSDNCLLYTMEDMGTNGDIMRWTESFMLDQERRPGN